MGSSLSRFENSQNVKVSEGGGGMAPASHDSESLCLYPLNFVNLSPVRQAAGGDCAGNPAANEHVKTECVLNSAFWTELPGCLHPERFSV
jgi:hypothetical protein